MNFFETINRWQFVVLAVVILAGINLGIYYFSYLPGQSPPAGPSQDLTVPVEDTAPKTVSKTPPARQSTPPPGKTQYRP